MAVFCPRCHRANPDNAVFCYHDGIPLQATSVSQTVSAEITFPSGRRVRTPEELGQACLLEWGDACMLLKRGDLLSFLQRLGRLDLVRSVQEALSQSDIDMALYNFIGALPGARDNGPRLELQPRRLALSKVAAGTQQALQIVVGNRGQGLLQGKVVVTEGKDWLRFASGAGDQLNLRTERDQPIPLQMDTRSLVAGQTYSGKLTVISNGGIAELPVRLELAALPFPHAPYQGANSPRELAQRMLANPKPAVALLESGQVAEWFTANSWSYPVPGAAARGIGGVQQFFECLGLSKPPPLQLSDELVRLQCVSAQAIPGQVTLRTTSRKWVYAQINSDAPWLRVLTPSVSGPQQVQLAFEIDPAELKEQGVQQTNLRILANGNQKLAVKIQVEVKRAPVAAGNRLMRPMVVTALLLLGLRLLLALPADYFSRIRLAGTGADVATLGYWMQLPVAESGFLRCFVLTTWWTGAVLGFLLVWRAGGRAGDRLCGLIAGSAAGLAGWSVLGCLILLLDAGPRWMAAGLARMLGAGLSPWVSIPLWLVLLGVCWGLIGAALGLVLGLSGSWGIRILVGICRFCGMGRAAGWLEGR